jgi:NADPH2:quinone reductase
MKAVLCKAWGDPSTLVIEDAPSPPIRGGEVRIGVQACAINFADILMIAGKYQVRPPFPFSPGLEAAGDVLEVGDGVDHVKVGDRVMAICNYGGYAEEVIAPAPMTVPIPDSMSFVHAAAFPVAYGTSHIALTDRAHLKAGETLLVLGAAGGVGLTAVEIGKHLGAKVIAAAGSKEKLAIAEQYGAEMLINYREESIRDKVKAYTGGAGADVIYDPVGGDAFDEAIRAINWDGRLLVVGFASGRIPELAINRLLIKNCAVIGVFWGAYALNNPQAMFKSLKTLLGWYQEGVLKPHISATFELEDAASAMQMLTSRQSTGKVVLTIGGS